MGRTILKTTVDKDYTASNGVRTIETRTTFKTKGLTNPSEPGTRTTIYPSGKIVEEVYDRHSLTRKWKPKPA